MNAKDMFFITLLAITTNMLLGVIIYSIIDDENGSLLKWFGDARFKLVTQPMVLTLWPVLLFLYFRYKYAKGEQHASQESESKL